MTIKELIVATRSYRRFQQDERVGRGELEELVELARLSASGQNRQPLKYFLATEPEVNELIFAHLGWAAYLEDWAGPGAGERPAAYVLILGDRAIGTSFGVDHGIAAQSIRLGASEKGLGSCIIASIERKKLADALELSERFEILLAIAIGKPKETVVVETIGPDGDVRYWRDKNSVHHVPKRALAEIIVNREGN